MFIKKIAITPGIDVDIDGMKVKVAGSQASLERDFSNPMFDREIKIEKEGDIIKVSTGNEKRKIKAMVGTIAAHIKNMINGINTPYVYKLKIVFMHFPMTVKVTGNKLLITNFLGGRANKTAVIPENIKVEIQGDTIIVSSHDKEAAGRFAALIESLTKISARDRRIFQDGIFIVEKPC